MIPSKHLMTTVLALSAFCCPTATYAQSGRGWMDGFIVHESTTNAASGAKVELIALAPRSGSGKPSTKANERGEYQLKDVPYGDYLLRVSSERYEPYQVEIYVMPDVQTRIHVRLKKKAT